MTEIEIILGQPPAPVPADDIIMDFPLVQHFYLKIINCDLSKMQLICSVSDVNNVENISPSYSIF